ncbi:hypothetical protein AB0O01_35000 [Streptomyces sp. NPDC093252]|uniref:hypothetical protein n=1 Tax=Streptomyces sp. NPDC093252 TaxID=3154980 RepID=UPI00341E375E
MNPLLATLGGKLTERWLNLLVLPGALFLAATAVGTTLGHRHWNDLDRLRATLDDLAAHPALDRTGTAALLIALALLAATAASLAAQFLGGGVERYWLRDGRDRFSRALTARRARLWRQRDDALDAAVTALRPTTDGPTGTTPAPTNGPTGTTPNPTAEPDDTTPNPTTEPHGTTPAPTTEPHGTTPIPTAEPDGTTPIPTAEPDGTTPIPANRRTVAVLVTADALARVRARTEARDRVAPRPPARPTWYGDRMQAAADRVEAAYGVDLAVLWPRLWLILPEPAVRQLQSAHDSFAAAARLAAWSAGYALLACWWWPAVLAAAGCAAVAHLRARTAIESLASLIEAAVDVHGRELAAKVGLLDPETPGRLAPETGDDLSAVFRKSE